MTETTTLDKSTSVTTTTEFETNTETDTVTETSTVVTTTTIAGPTETTTVATPAGFTPIKSVYGDNGQPSKRSPEQTAAALYRRATFPEDVVPCTLTATDSTTVTSTSTSTSTIEAAAPTSTATETSTITTVSTVLQEPATSTETTTELVQTTTTVTTTATTASTSTTMEAAGPTATYYAACADDNILTSYMGSGVQWTQVDGAVNQVGTKSPYDCCVECQKSSTCGLSFTWYGRCYLAEVGVCNPRGDAAYFHTVQVQADGLSNGRCGRWFL